MIGGSEGKDRGDNEGEGDGKRVMCCSGGIYSRQDASSDKKDGESPRRLLQPLFRERHVSRETPSSSIHNE